MYLLLINICPIFYTFISDKNFTKNCDKYLSRAFLCMRYKYFAVCLNICQVFS